MLLDADNNLSVPYAGHIELRPVGQLIRYARRARTHSDRQIEKLAASIRELGFNDPIAIDSKNEVICGDGRLLAAQRLGLECVPVIILDHLSDLQKRAYRLAANRLAEEAGWDDELLQLELGELAEADIDLSLTGFDEEELARLAADGRPETDADEDAIPDPPKRPVTRPGDLWKLGPHAVYCGDATSTSDLDRLVTSEKVDLVFSDPPYNVDYHGYTPERLTITGDSMSREQFEAFLSATFTGCRHIVAAHASLYIFHPSSWQREFQTAMEVAGFEVRGQLIWTKNTFAWGFGRYKFQHEPIFYAHVRGERDLWFGDKSQSTVWEANKPAANRMHPTAKPVELIERALLNSSKTGAIVADLFGGSGSTLIACQRRARKARLMEIDPAYCDVIVRRWQDYTRKAAVLDGSGMTFAQIEGERIGFEASVAAAGK